MRPVTGGQTDFTEYFQMRLLAGGGGTGLTIADFDLSYTRSRAATSAKVDATALLGAGAAHTDNYMYEVDPTDCPGLYRVDWPDAAFVAGAEMVGLTVKHTLCFTETLRVVIDAGVNVTKIVGDAAGAAGCRDQFNGTGLLGNPFPLRQDQGASIAGGLAIHTAMASVTVIQGSEQDLANAATSDDARWTGDDDGAGAEFIFRCTPADTTTLPVDLHFEGYYNEPVGATNAATLSVYNFATASWDSLIAFVNASADELHDLSLLHGHSAPGGDTLEGVAYTIGDVLIKFEQDTQETGNACLLIDRIAVGFVGSLITAEEIVDEWETQSQADPTGFHVNVREVSGTSQTGNDNGADINAIKVVTDVLPDSGALNDLATILADTNELQADDIPGLLAAIAAYIDTEVAAIKAVTDVLPDAGALTTIGTDTARLTAVRAAVLTDLIDGGRLDLLIDLILARLGAITGSGDNTLLGIFKAALSKDAATPSDIGGTFDPAADSVEAIRDRGDAAWSAGASSPVMLLNTTIAVVNGQTSFTLTDGPDFDGALEDQTVVVYDDSNNDYPSVRTINTYTGATKTCEIDEAPAFTILAGDGVKVFATAPGSTAPTAAQNADAVCDEALGGHVGAGTVGAALGNAWSTENLKQIRIALGLTGDTQATSGTGLVDLIKAITDKFLFDGSNYVKAVEQVKTGSILAASGLDAITNTEPVLAGDAMNFAQALVRLCRRFNNKHTLTSTWLTQYADDETTPTVKQAVSEAGGTQTVEELETA